MISLFDFPERNVFLAVKDDFRKFVFQSAEDVVGGRRELARHLSASYSAVSEWETGYKMRTKGVKEEHHCPLRVYKQLLRLLPAQELEDALQRNVLSYKGDGPSAHIQNPILPIHDTCGVVNLVAHVFSDGCVPSDRKGQPFYCNSSADLIGEFASDLCAFGDVETRKGFNSETGVRRLFFPLVLARILEHVYHMNFPQHRFFQPSQVPALSNEEKGAFLRGFFDDEGYVHDSNLQICSLHEETLDMLTALLSDLGISAGRQGKYRDYVRADGTISSVKYFDIPSRSIPAFAKLVGFTHPKKREHLAHILLRQQRGWKHPDAAKTRQIILQELANGSTTARALSHKTLITMRNVRGSYLKVLEDEGVVLKLAKQKGKGGAVLWALSPTHSKNSNQVSDLSQRSDLASQPISSG